MASSAVKHASVNGFFSRSKTAPRSLYNHEFYKKNIAAVSSLVESTCNLPVVISGAGIAGLASAVALHKVLVVNP
jgi:hypothetical protein